MGITLKGGNGEKLAELIKKLSSAKSVDIGWNEEARYPSTHRNGGDFVANVAVINEFGGNWSESAEGGGEEIRQIPARPFFRTMIASNKDQFGTVLARAIVKNNYDAHAALTVLGTVVGTELKRTIIGWKSPGNAKRTIKRKGFDDPLNESGEMQNTVNHWVK